jgi:hypothetical protein
MHTNTDIPGFIVAPCNAKQWSSLLDSHKPQEALSCICQTANCPKLCMTSTYPKNT